MPLESFYWHRHGLITFFYVENRRLHMAPGQLAEGRAVPGKGWRERNPRAGLGLWPGVQGSVRFRRLRNSVFSRGGR